MLIPIYASLSVTLRTRILIKSLPGPFDVILIVDTLGAIDDCQHLFESLHSLCTRETRLITAYFSHLWYPIIKLGEKLRLRMPQPPQNVLSLSDIRSLAAIADFEAVKIRVRMLIPFRLLGVGRLVNRFVAPLPLMQQASAYVIIQYFVPSGMLATDVKSATVIVPARNERGNIEAAVQRIPRFAEDIEIIFVEGHSQDGTWDEITACRGRLSTIRHQGNATTW